MAPNSKAYAACHAMMALGISKDKTKQVLKKLLTLYDKNWELIEAENYRALADAIFEEDDSVAENKKIDEEVEEEIVDEAMVQSEPPLKRLRRGRDVQCSPSSDTKLKKPRLEEVGQTERFSPNETLKFIGSPMSRAESCPISSHVIKNKGKQPVFSESLVPVPPQGRVSPGISRDLRLKEPMTRPGISLLPKQKGLDSYPLIEPKEEPFTDDMSNGDMQRFEIPLQVIHPDPMSNRNFPVGNDWTSNNITGDLQQFEPIAVIHPDPLSKKDVPVENEESDKEIGKKSFSKCVGGERVGDGVVPLSGEGGTNYELITTREESSSNLDVATSPSGEDGNISISPDFDILKKSTALDALGVSKNLCIPSCMSNELVSSEGHTVVAAPLTPVADGSACCDKDNGEVLESTDMYSLVVAPQYELAPSDIRSFHDISDISRGEERVRIPWATKANSECPPSFYYISQSIVFQNAAVNFSLSRIGDLSCCPTCFGDCVSASVPCVCANELDGEFAYTSAGLLKEVFLETSISMTRDPQHQHLIYCGECPLEKARNDDCLEPCKGHVERKFVKECWSKCGCNKQCGNRVVQRGITCKLEVFFTSEGKGWGLRTREDLPKGAFVCEYIGEILTSTELYQRNMQCNKSGKDTYLVLLDADWGPKGASKNEKALCLDASRFGNVSRFINHRCLDANLVEIPVEVESPDHHYYHLAFFTTRKINALEELTWDYGIDFDDHDHPIKPFQCQCGSKFCRNIKRQNTTFGICPRNQKKKKNTRALASSVTQLLN
ncbi:hypothetical protein UlMin_031747 [Ulmus minor]